MVKSTASNKNAILLSFLILLGGVSQMAADIRYIRHYEYAKPIAPQYSVTSFPQKTERLSSTKGEISINFVEDIPDSIKNTVNVVKELWESKLHNKNQVLIDVYYESLDNGIAIFTETGMHEIDNKLYPAALAAQLPDNMRDPSTSMCDGCIIINADINWDCSFSTNSGDSYNLPTMMLRGIARCLGFISNLGFSEQYGYGFSWFMPTIFDSHLYVSNSCLSLMEPYSQEIADFATSDRVIFNTDLSKYNIYAPKQFKNGESLCYLKDDNFLMSQSLGKGNTLFTIDYPTLDILNAIGWDLPFEELRIKCLDMDDTGIGSSYQNHTFMLADNNLKIDSFSWTFFLKNKSGKYEQISTGKSSTFTIEKISNSDKYHINVNGDLEGKIECIYKTGGKEFLAEPFKVSLEQKPQIISISDIKQTWDKYNYSLDFNIEYAGAEKFSIKIEEEYCYNITTQRIDKPFFAHVNTRKISGLYYSWVTIEVSNQYGTTRRTLEFPPYSGEYNAKNHNDKKIPISSISENSEIKVYNLSGELVFNGDANQISQENIPSGIYIRKEKLSSGDTLTTKMIIK